MQRIFTTIILFFLLTQVTFGQSELACDGQRYVDDVFTDFTVTTVTYGSNTTFLGLNQDLQMDIYEPVGDTHTQRPVIIFAFGGSFIFGARESMAQFCELFVKRGYVAVTIDYRLGFLGTSEDAITGAVVRAVGDMKAAIRFFRQDAATTNTFKIHPDFILAGGYSAGAITATHAAYLDLDDNLTTNVVDIVNDNGGINGDTGDATNQSYSSDIFAVYSLSGALQRKEYLDNETEPLVSFHGTADGTVPFNNGLANGLATVDGSGLLHQQADAIGLDNYLRSVEGGDHVDIHFDAFFENEQNEFNANSAVFLHNLMCPDFLISVSTDDLLKIQQSLDIYPNPSEDVMNFDFGKLESDYSIRVYDQVGRLVTSLDNQNDNKFSLNKSEIGTGMFFVNVLFEDLDVAPLTRRIVFK